MYGRNYNIFDDDDDYDDDDDDRYYHVEEDSEKEEDNNMFNNLNEETMEGNLRALEMSWFITISSAKCEYKLALISVVSIRLLKTTVTSNDGFTRTNYDGLEFITSAGRFVCQGIYYADVKYGHFSDLKSWIHDINFIKCESVEFIPWVSMQNGNHNNDNHSNQLNPNNAEFQHSRGEK